MSGLSSRWRTHRDRYGAIHAAAAYLGRSSQRLWDFLGPAVTRAYLRRWYASAPAHLVNLGSGALRIEAMLNVDISARADVYVDITRPLPFHDDSLDGVFCEEVIEHVPFPAAARMLREVHRALRPDAALRISTPDLAHFCRLAAGAEPMDGYQRAEARLVLGADAGEALMRAAALNAIVYRHEHRFVYTEAALREALLAAGFSQVRRSRYRDPEGALGAHDSHAERYGHAPEMSLYLEARKG